MNLHQIIKKLPMANCKSERRALLNNDDGYRRKNTQLFRIPRWKSNKKKKQKNDLP